MKLFSQNIKAQAKTNSRFKKANIHIQFAVALANARKPIEARIVEIKFFGGLKIDEIAEVLGVSSATVNREWASAKLLLYKC